MDQNQPSWGKRLLTAIVVALLIQVPRGIIENKERAEELKTKYKPIKIDFSSKEINLFSLIYLQLTDKDLQARFLYNKHFRYTKNYDPVSEKKTEFEKDGDNVTIYDDKSLSYTAYNIFKNITADSLKYYGFEYEKHEEMIYEGQKSTQDYYVNRPKNLILSINLIQNDSISRYFVNMANYDAFLKKAKK